MVDALAPPGQELTDRVSGDSGSSNWMYEAPPGTAAGASAAATSSMASRTPCSSMTSRETTVSPNTEQYFSTADSRSRQAIPT